MSTPVASQLRPTRSAPRVVVQQRGEITTAEQESAAEILCHGFWTCNSPVLRFRAHNDRPTLLELMRSRVKAASATGGLFLSYEKAEPVSGTEPGGGEGGEGQMVGTVIVTMPGEDMAALQKSYGDKDKVVKDESEAERKTRIWVEEDLVPFCNDFSARALGPGVQDASLYISMFAMAAEAQGKGLGRETMEQVVQWGDEQGWEMTLFDHEPELVKFYSSFGFQEAGREMRPCDGHEVTWWAMKRAIPGQR